MRGVLLICVGLGVSGCGLFPFRPAAPPPPALFMVSTDDVCGAPGFQPMVGRSITEVLAPADRPVRVIAPDTAVTSDMRRDRLNFDVDEDGTVLAVSCG